MKIFLLLLVCAAVLWLFLWAMGRKKYPVSYGISFNQIHATSLGLDWKEVYEEMLIDLEPQFVRIAAMWSEVQPEEKDTFDFSDVDWMMDTAAAHDVAVTLVVGQKAPRWPECHVPAWVLDYQKEDVRTDLLQYVSTTVARYKDHTALEFWQIENEPFIRFEFGECEGFQEDAIYEEIEIVRELDPDRKIVVTDSGELSTWRKAAKTGDIFGTTLYRIVQTPNGMTWTYDWLPAGFYKLKAMLWGKSYDDFFVAELQAEPWFTDSTPLDTPTEEQEKTMNVERLLKHIDYSSRVGASRAYLWGVEWWWYMKEVRDDARYWEIVQDVI